MTFIPFWSNSSQFAKISFKKTAVRLVCEYIFERIANNHKQTRKSFCTVFTYFIHFFNEIVFFC